MLCHHSSYCRNVIIKIYNCASHSTDTNKLERKFFRDEIFFFETVHVSEKNFFLLSRLFIENKKYKKQAFERVTLFVR